MERTKIRVSHLKWTRVLIRTFALALVLVFTYATQEVVAQTTLSSARAVVSPKTYGVIAFNFVESEEAIENLKLEVLNLTPAAEDSEGTSEEGDTALRIEFFEYMAQLLEDGLSVDRALQIGYARVNARVQDYNGSIDIDSMRDRAVELLTE